MPPYVVDSYQTRTQFLGNDGSDFTKRPSLYWIYTEHRLIASILTNRFISSSQFFGCDYFSWFAKQSFDFEQISFMQLLGAASRKASNLWIRSLMISKPPAF